MRGHPQKAPAASHEKRSYPRLLDFATGSKKYPRHPTVDCLYISHTWQYTFGNRFEVYWYDAGDGVLHEDDWHFKLMRWQLIALYVIIGDGS